MNMDDDTNGQPIVWRPVLSDGAQRQIDKPPLVDAASDDGDIFALMPPPQHTTLLHIDGELRRGSQDGLRLRIAQGELRRRHDRIAAPDSLKYQRHN